MVTMKMKNWISGLSTSEKGGIWERGSQKDQSLEEGEGRGESRYYSKSDLKW